MSTYRSGRRSTQGLKSWNFWTEILGTTYEFTCWHPDDMHLPETKRRRIAGYGGKTAQVPWTKRIEDHLWARHHRNKPPKPWRDTVPGWCPNGTVGEVIAAGGVRVTWQAHTVPLILTLVEWFYSIKWRRPYYNYIGNMRNRRRITPAQQRAQAALRAGRVPDEVVTWTSRPRVPGGLLPAVVLAVLGVLFFPGMPGYTAAVWVVANWRSLALVLLVGVGAFVVASARPSRTRRRSRRKRRHRARSSLLS